MANTITIFSCGDCYKRVVGDSNHFLIVLDNFDKDGIKYSNTLNFEYLNGVLVSLGSEQIKHSDLERLEIINNYSYVVRTWVAAMNEINDLLSLYNRRVKKD